MKVWIEVLAGVIPGTLLLLLLLLFWWRRRKQQQFVSNTNTEFSEAVPKPSEDTFQATIAKLHLSHKSNSKTGLRFHHLHQHHNHNHNQHQTIQQQLPPFNWDDHPRLVLEAAQHGWSRFVFANRSSVPRSSPLWGLCAVCDSGRLQEAAEINLEVPRGSPEFMQTVRINPAGAKKSSSSNSNNSPLWVADDPSCGCTRMSLPLPGPPLIGSSFPQEAYFEITILYLQPRYRISRASKRAKDGSGDDGEDDRMKLIEENSVKIHSDAFAHAIHVDDDRGIDVNNPIPMAKSITGEGKHNNIVISLGLTKGGSSQTKSKPGTYPGSIGFHSNGSVYLDGMKLVPESERTEWAGVNRVIGCGFNPSKKKVFLTVDSELVHAIRCNSDVYKSPMYPVLAANVDVMVLVNLGQAAFKYAPANARRTPNPCVLRPSPSYGGTSVIGYEDSRELFSMGRIDSECLGDDKKSKSPSNRSSKRSNGISNFGSFALDVDEESDLFEIALHS